MRVGNGEHTHPPIIASDTLMALGNNRSYIRVKLVDSLCRLSVTHNLKNAVIAAIRKEVQIKQKRFSGVKDILI